MDSLSEAFFNKKADTLALAFLKMSLLLYHDHEVLGIDYVHIDICEFCIIVREEGKNLHILKAKSFSAVNSNPGILWSVNPWVPHTPGN